MPSGVRLLRVAWIVMAGTALTWWILRQCDVKTKRSAVASAAAATRSSCGHGGLSRGDAHVLERARQAGVCLTVTPVAMAGPPLARRVEEAGEALSAAGCEHEYVSVGAPSAPEYVLGDICAAARRFRATGDATSALAGGDLASCTLG